ncbi:MAG TPA: YceI family protein [Rhizomicrobium sp.]|nr:YceI family protein [Rhizomicrobium sp.]
MKQFFIGAAVAALLIVSQGHAATIKPVSTPAPAGDYTLDKAHASLIFRVDHMGFSNFTARFAHFDAKLTLDPAHPAKSSVDATIDPNSLETDNPPAGFLDMLHGVQWLDAGKFPAITFHSTRIMMTSPNTARITGDFSLHGVTRPLVLTAKFNGGYAGFALDPHARVGFSAHGALKRSDFGIAYGIPAPGTKMGVGDLVDVTIEAEFNGPAWTPKSQ